METNSENSLQIPTSDEKLLALLSHLSMFMGGIILPLIIWATQKEKSKFVRFHSLQAIFYQLSLAGIIILFVFIFLIIMLVSGIGLGALTDGQSGSGKEMPTFFIILMVILYGGIFILTIGGIGYSVYVALKSYKGELIRIPFIGNIIYQKVYGQA
ncbi:MAG TPA: DUF4870 domain-containing protein [Ignavibacteria bacterium]|nr:DUF4870 domain-containing protein [Ignavibacteria bacterium]